MQYLKDIIEKNGHKLVRYNEAESGHQYKSVFNYSEQHGGTFDSYKYYNDYVVDVTVQEEKMTKYVYRKRNYQAAEKHSGIIEAFANIQNAVDLRKNHLNLSSYHCIPGMMHELFQNGKTRTIIKDAAEWFGKQGCKVTNAGNVEYIIEY